MAREQRRLAAIVAADVAGYSRLMGRDESGTLARLREHRQQRFEPALARHGGRLVKLTGDGALAEFPSAVDAVGAAIEFQQAMAEVNRDQPEDGAIVFRIGLHLGDLIVDGDDLYGDGVNLAARLETEAPAGGIVISRAVHEAVAGRLKAGFEDLGSLMLKNIDRPIQAFGVKWDPADWKVSTPSIAASPTAHVPLTLPDKPSIAVLPFQNMSGDPEQEYFTDGITEDIITELSRFRSLFVIARNSSFTYKGKPIGVRTVAHELGVRYVLEGSIRKAANRVRVTAQLIDATSANQLWSERYDRVLEDIFAVQEELTRSIVAAIAPEINVAEELRALRRKPDNLTAYEIALRANAYGLEAYQKQDRALFDRSIAEAEQALAIDQNSVAALRCLAMVRAVAAYTWSVPDSARLLRLAESDATRVVQLDAASASGYAARAFCITLSRQHERYGDALADARRANELNPNDTFALYVLGLLELYTGDPGGAIEHGKRIVRLNPLDRHGHLTHVMLASSCFMARRYAEGLEWAMRARMDNERLFLGRLNAMYCFVGLGEIGKAKAEFSAAREISPGWIKAVLDGRSSWARPEDRLRELTFLRVAADLEDPSAADALR
jgi:adenylate cyclase